ncbi:hypothetical protein CCP3SC15_4240002 [Gammaproteobacteria bacterium]
MATMETTQEQRAMLVDLLAKRLTNLEFQLNNQDHLSKSEIKTVKANYLEDRNLLLRLIQDKAKEMKYPPMKDWVNTQPMTEINNLSNGAMAKTEAYHEILEQIIMI